MAIITGSINMAGLKHVKMTAKGKSGEVKGMFIPFNANHIKATDKGGVYLNLVAFELKEKKEYGTHIIKQSFNKETREKLGEDALKELPILGNLNVDNTPSETNNDAGGGEQFTEETTVPF